MQDMSGTDTNESTCKVADDAIPAQRWSVDVSNNNKQSLMVSVAERASMYERGKIGATSPVEKPSQSSITQSTATNATTGPNQPTNSWFAIFGSKAAVEYCTNPNCRRAVYKAERMFVGVGLIYHKPCFVCGGTKSSQYCDDNCSRHNMTNLSKKIDRRPLFIPSFKPLFISHILYQITYLIFQLFFFHEPSDYLFMQLTTSTSTPPHPQAEPLTVANEYSISTHTRWPRDFHFAPIVPKKSNRVHYLYTGELIHEHQ